jgi:DNA-binding PadR family transcriptional regulator
VRLTYSTALVLVAVGHGIRYGFDIIDASGLQSGTVYPILRRLEDAGYVKSSWERATVARDEQRPPRRYYRLTGTGSEALRDALERYPAIAQTFAGARRPLPA